MGSKGYTFFGNLPQISQTEYLKTTTVSQNSSIPVHKLMQAASLLDQCGAWSKEKMVGIAEDNASPQFLYLFWRYALYRALSSYWHKNRCRKAPMRCMDNAGPGSGSRILLN